MMIHQTLIIALALSLCSCGTITPNHVSDGVAISDSSTPSQYEHGWVLFKTVNKLGKVDGAVITDNALIRYNALIENYKIQFKKSHLISLTANIGVRDYKDQYDNNLHWISAEYLEYFGWMSQMSKDGVPQDSLIQKIGDHL